MLPILLAQLSVPQIACATLGYFVLGRFCLRCFKLLLPLEGAFFNRPQKGPAWPVALAIKLARVKLCPLAPNDAQKGNLRAWRGGGGSVEPVCWFYDLKK